MAGVRWRSVLPCSVLLLTFIATRNVYIYVSNLPQDGSTFASEVSDDRRLNIAYRRHDGSERGPRRGVDADERPEADSDDQNPKETPIRKHSSEINSKMKAFNLFPEDEKVANGEQNEKAVGDESDRRFQNPGLLGRSHESEDNADRKDIRDDDTRKVEREEPSRIEQAESNSKLKAFNLFPDDVESVKGERREDKRTRDLDMENQRIEDQSHEKGTKHTLNSGHEGSSVNLVAHVQVDSLMLLNDSMANSSLREDQLMMANMGEVGVIVRKMKESPARGGSESANRQPVKPHPFKYVINSPKICNDDDVFAVVYIHTAPDHHKRRTVIRQTWGDSGHYDVTVRLVFVMGIVLGSDSLSAQNALFFEAGQYGDIVQEDFVDSYHNLTHKGVAALKWVATYCQQAVFVLKTDDDIFVNMYTLIRYLKKLTRISTKPQGVLMCLVWNSMPVLREGKWKVTKEEWPEDSYPTYCSGSAFVMSTDVAVAMYRVSYDVPFFWVDDFYITGLLPLKLGNVTHRQFASAYVLNGDLLESAFTGSQWYTYVFSHVHNLDRIQSVWDKLTQLVSGKIVATIQSRTANPNRQ